MPKDVNYQHRIATTSKRIPYFKGIFIYFTNRRNVSKRKRYHKFG